MRWLPTRTPCRVGGTARPPLPGGFDATIADAFKRRDADQPFNTLCAIAAEIPKGGRGGGLAAEILKAMGDIAVTAMSPHQQGDSTFRFRR